MEETVTCASSSTTCHSLLSFYARIIIITIEIEIDTYQSCPLIINHTLFIDVFCFSPSAKCLAQCWDQFACAVARLASATPRLGSVCHLPSCVAPRRCCIALLWWWW